MNWKDLPASLRLYISVVAVFAIPLLAWAILELGAISDHAGWVVLTILTVLTVPFFHFLPSVNTIVGIGDAYVMAIAMLYGPAPCIVATFCHSLFASLFVPNRKIRPHRVVFNVSSTVCIAWIYSNAYRLMQRSPEAVPDVPDLVLPAVVLTVTFFLFNSLSTATAISLASGQKVIQFWVSNYMPLAVDFTVSAVSATFIVSLYGVRTWAPFAAAPLIGVVWGWNKLNKAKVMEAEKHLREQEELYLRTVESLALAVDAKDQTTYGHIRRVRAYAMGLARLCGITDKNELMAIETGSLLHDIGKLAIDDYILNKPGRLSKQEFEKMKLHAPAGHEILEQIQFPFPVAKYVRFHHERWDGGGYPDGLRGEEIPLGARILSIADAFDAIRSARPYKLSFGTQDSVELLRSQSGTMYDPQLIELFIQHLGELENAAEEAAKDVPKLSFRKYFEKVDLALLAADSSMVPASLPSSASSELVNLYEFCQGVARHLDLSESLPILARRLKRMIPYTTLAFFLDNGEDALRARYVTGKFSTVLRNLTIGLGKGISGWVAAYRRPIVNTGPALEFQEIEGDFTCLTDTLVVPIFLDDQCLGTISLYAEAPVFYSQAHLGVLQIVAGQIAPLMSEKQKPSTSDSGRDLLDPVTGSHRFGVLPVVGEQMLNAAGKNQAPLSLLYLDLRDHRHLVTLYGVQTGESILRKACEVLRAELRETDIIVRFGDQGFVALLAGVGEDRARRYAQRVQQQIRSTPLGNAAGHGIFSLAQTAVASFPENGSTVLALLEFAQQSIAGDTRRSARSGEDADGNILEFPPRI